VIGDLLDAVVGHVSHRDTSGTRCVKVDVVNADPVARDHFAALEGGDGIGVDCRICRQDRIGLGGLCSYGFGG
jgi:hypothetical protein